jgi:hypothetical protein
MADSETLLPDPDTGQTRCSQSVKGETTDDFPSMFVDVFKKVNFKIAFFIFIIGIFIFSDIFIENIIKPWSSDAVDGADTPTSKGVFIQLIFLTLGYIGIDLLVQGGVL